MSTRAAARSVGPARAGPSPRAGPSQRPYPASSRPRGASRVALRVTRSNAQPSPGIPRPSVKGRPIHATTPSRSSRPPACSAAKGPEGPAAPSSPLATTGTGSMASAVLALATEANQVRFCVRPVMPTTLPPQHASVCSPALPYFAVMVVHCPVVWLHAIMQWCLGILVQPRGPHAYNHRVVKQRSATVQDPTALKGIEQAHWCQSRQPSKHSGCLLLAVCPVTDVCMPLLVAVLAAGPLSVP